MRLSCVGDSSNHNVRADRISAAFADCIVRHGSWIVGLSKSRLRLNPGDCDKGSHRDEATPLLVNELALQRSQVERAQSAGYATRVYALAQVRTGVESRAGSRFGIVTDGRPLTSWQCSIVRSLGSASGLEGDCWILIPSESTVDRVDPFGTLGAG